jgi:hypothetical protein
MFNFFKRKRKKEEGILSDLGPNSTVRVVGRGGFQQDPQEIYDSENYKRAQAAAHLIVRRDPQN